MWVELCDNWCEPIILPHNIALCQQSARLCNRSYWKRHEARFPVSLALLFNLLCASIRQVTLARRQAKRIILNFYAANSNWSFAGKKHVTFIDLFHCQHNNTRQLHLFCKFLHVDMAAQVEVIMIGIVDLVRSNFYFIFIHNLILNKNVRNYWLMKKSDQMCYK